jgi:hypothetical protein
MATKEQVRDAMQAQPFRAFTVLLVDGRSYTIKHPDFIAVPSSPRGRELMIYDDQGSHFIDMGLIVEVHLPDAVASPPTVNP